MGDDLKDDSVPTGDLLGIETEKPKLRLRPNQPINRRSGGIIFDDNFQVSAEQEATDKELVNQVYSGKFSVSYLISFGL